MSRVEHIGDATLYVLDTRSVWTAFDIQTDEPIGQVFVNDQAEALAMILRMGALEGSFYVKPSTPEPEVNT